MNTLAAYLGIEKLVDNKQGFIFTFGQHYVIALFDGNLTQAKRMSIAERIRPIHEWITGIENKTPLEHDAKILEYVGIREKNISIESNGQLVDIVYDKGASTSIPANFVHIIKC